MRTRTIFGLSLALLGLALLVTAPASIYGQITQVSQADQDAQNAQAAQYNAQLMYRMDGVVNGVWHASGLAGKPAFAEGIAPVGPGAETRVAPSGMRPFEDRRGTEVSETTVYGLTMVRDMYILQAEWMADFFDSIRDGGVADKRERVQAARKKASELAALYDAAQKATEAKDAFLARTRGEDFMSPAEKEQSVAETLEHLKAEEAAWKAFNDAADAAGRSFPELLIEVKRPDGEGIPLWSALGRFPREGVEADMDDILSYNRYLEQGAADLRRRAEVARGHDTLDELWQYLRPEFRGIRGAVDAQGKSAHSDLPGQFMDELEGVGRAFDMHTAVDEGWTKVLLAGTGAIAILISPALCLTVSVIDVTMEGDQLVVAYRTADEATQAAPILGFRHVITAEQRAKAAEGEFVLAAIGVGLDATAIASVRIVGAADCPKDAQRAGEAADAGRAGGAADAGADAGRVGDAADAARAADAAPKRWGHLGDATVDEAFGHPNIPDDAWVHFGGSEIADGIRQDGVLGRSYWGRWGEVKNWTQGELRFNIGSMSKSGLSDLKTMVVAPDNAPIRLKRGEYGFEVEGVTDEAIQGGRVIVAGDEPAVAAGRVGDADAPGRPGEPPGPPRARDVARGAPEPEGLRPDDVEFWRRNEAERIERDRGYGIQRTDETDAKLERFNESIQAAHDAGIPRADIDKALDEVRRKPVSIPSEGQTPLDVAIKDFRIRMVITEAIRKDLTIVIRESDRVYLDALGGGNAKVVVIEPADANLVVAKAATDRGQGATTWTAQEAELARRLQREDPEKLYVFDPEQFEGGLYPLLDTADAANLKRIFGEGAPPPPVVDRGPPSGPPPDVPQRPLDPEADTSLEAGRARQPGDERPPDHQTQRLQPGEVDESLRDAETVRIPGEADEVAGAPPRPLLSADEYKDLVARQAGGERLDLNEIARPGIARGTPDGGLGIAQGAGRWENTRPGDWLDVFVDARTPLPDGAIVLERGIDPEVVRQANLLSSRGQEGTNPMLVDVAIRDVPEFVRVRVKAGDVVAPTSKVASLIEDELARLGSEGVDVDRLRRAMEDLSPNERLAILRDDAARAHALAGAQPLPAPHPDDQPGEMAVAPLDADAAEGPPAGAGNVPRALEGGNVPPPAENDVRQDVPPPDDARPDEPGRPNDEVGALPGAGEGNQQVAGIGSTFPHTISPIDFYMYPVLDLGDQSYTAINIPVTLATGRDVRIQIVILSGPEEEGRTRERRPGDPRPDRPPTRTGWIGDTEEVPGGGILIFPENPQVLVRSLGTLGGGAMEMQVFDAEPGQERISAEGLVVEPVQLDQVLQQRLEQELHALAGRNPITAKLDAYCLDFLRQPPELGTVFRIADKELQERFAPLRDVLQAGRRLHEAGLLNPDSDPEEYFHSIRQWALWSVQENLELGSFGDAFVEHTRKNFETAGQPWTGEVEGLVRSLVPNRWNDIAAIVEEARSSGATSAGGGSR